VWLYCSDRNGIDRRSIRYWDRTGSLFSAEEIKCGEEGVGGRVREYCRIIKEIDVLLKYNYRIRFIMPVISIKRFVPVRSIFVSVTAKFFHSQSGINTAGGFFPSNVNVVVLVGCNSCGTVIPKTTMKSFVPAC
jgi:hypothetical protein